MNFARLIQLGIENEKKHNADCNNKGKQHQRNLQEVEQRHARELLEIKKRHEQEMANLHHSNTTSKNQNQRQQQMLTEKKDIIQTNINTLNTQNLPKPFVQTLVPSTANPQMPEPPNEFLCPINQELMIDPVTDNEGISYERKAIEDWLRLGNLRFPITNKALRLKDLRPNIGLRNLIQHWKQNHSLSC